MIWSQARVQVRVPATSANLGPGFDAMGLALGLHDQVEAHVADAGLSIDVTGEGTGTAGAGERHLVVRAMRAAFERMGAQPPGLGLRCVNAIPHGRGLGSSAAAIVSGLLAARALVRDGESILPGEAVFRLAVELEGHPDNVAACLAGGLTVAWTPRPTAGEGPVRSPAESVLSGESGLPQETGRPAPASGTRAGTTSGPGGGREVASGSARTSPRLARVAVREDLRAVVCVPAAPVTTETARRVLPTAVPHADAAANAARSALLVLALTSEPALVFDATEDFLHQAYRAGVMPATADLLKRLRSRRIAAVISGAGPSVLALTFAGGGTGPDVVDSIAAETGIAWRVTPLDVDRQGALVRPGGLNAHSSGGTRQGIPDPGAGAGRGSRGWVPARPGDSPRDTPTTSEGMSWPLVVLDWASHRMPPGARCPLVTRRDAGRVVGNGW